MNVHRHVRTSTALFAAVCFASHVSADVVTQEIEYSDGETILKGYLAYDEALTEDVPGVLICHQWMGLGEHEKNTARRLAADGYVAFALDVYGVDNRPTNRSEASAAAGFFYANPDALRRRAALGLQQLRDHSWSDDDRLAAIGFCFGGTTVLELARSGAAVNGIVSLHGGLKTEKPASEGDITAKVLVLHGAVDPYVPAADVEAFMKEMEDAGVDWQMVSYGGAVHAFTQRSAGDDPPRGAAYDADAARRAWQHMMIFFDEIFAMPKRKPGLWGGAVNGRTGAISGAAAAPGKDD